MAKTKEEKLEYFKRYRQEHKAEISQSLKYYRKIHKDKFNSPEYKAKIKEASKRWVANNREKYNAYHREYRRKRKELQNATVTTGNTESK